MASIQRIVYPTGKVVYRVQIRRKGFPPRSEVFPERRLALNWAKTVEADMIRGTHAREVPVRSKRVRDAIQRFIEEVLPTPRYKDKKNPRGRLEWWAAEIGDLLLEEVSPELIEEKAQKLLTTPYARARPDAPNTSLVKGARPRRYYRSQKTVNRYLAALSKVFSLCRRPWRWTTHNPFAGVVKVPEKGGRVRIFQGDEQTRLLAQTAKDPQLHAVVHLALCCAPRAGEITNLMWEDVDQDALLASSADTVRVLLRETKNSEPRTAIVVGEALRLLREHWALAGCPVTGRVFQSRTGKMYRYHKPFVAAVRAAGIEDFHFHDLRHCAATWLAREGATHQQLKAIGGWKSNVVNRYVHLAANDVVDVVQRMNRKMIANKT